MQKFSIIISLLFLQLSCKSKTQETKVEDATSEMKTMAIEKMNTFKNKILNIGDTIAYNEVLSEYFITNRSNDVLYYSILMANKYKYPKASFDVYLILTNGLTRESLNQNLDSITFNFAFEYLTKSSKQGYEIATKELQKISLTRRSLN